MKANREDFAFWVGLMDQIIPKGKLTLEVHRAIVIDFDGKNLTLITNTHFNAMRVVELAAEGDPLTVAVDCEALTHACQGESEHIELMIGEEGYLRVQTAKSEYDLDTFELEEFSNPFEEEEDWQSCGEVVKGYLSDILGRSVPFLSNDPSRPILMGVYFSNEYLYACDAVQLARTKLEGMEVPDGLAFSPQGLLKVLDSGGDEKTKVHFQYNDVWASFTCGPFEFLVRRNDGEYGITGLDAGLKDGAKQKGEAKVDSEGLAKALSRVNYFLDTGFVRLVLSRKGISLEAFQGKRWVARTSVMGNSNKKEEVSVILEASHLEAMLTLVDKEMKLKMTDGESDFYLLSSDKLTEYLVLPVVEE